MAWTYADIALEKWRRNWDSKNTVKMSQDVVADVLNQIMNMKRAKKNVVTTTKFSKLLLNVLDIMKETGYIEYELKDGELKIKISEINECRAIKPRFSVNKKNLEKYIRRFLPSRNMGYVIVSTNKGIVTHQKARENEVGGSLIAYFY